VKNLASAIFGENVCCCRLHYQQKNNCLTFKWW